MTVYQVHVLNMIEQNGVSCWLRTGELVEYGSETFVRVSGMLVLADGWFPTEQEATAAAVAKLREYAQTLERQADEMEVAA